MSNEKKVWLSFFTWGYVDFYNFGISYKGLFDYKEYRLNELKLLQDKDNENLRTYNTELIKKRQEKLGVGNFNKMPVFPERLWIEINSEDEKPDRSENIFHVGSGLIFDEKFANILKKFRLGESTLTPLQIYALETGDLWRDEIYYFLNLCEKRSFMTHPQSSDVLSYLSYKKGGGIYRIRGDLIDNLVELDKSAMESDVDLWHDPLLRNSYFISDALSTALLKANVNKKSDMTFCKLIY